MKRAKVWEPRGEKELEEEPEWEIVFKCTLPEHANCMVQHFVRVRAPHAFAANQKVKGAPAFGSCRVRRVIE